VLGAGIAATVGLAALACGPTGFGAEALAQGTYATTSLTLEVDEKVVVRRRALIRASGSSLSPATLSIFVDPSGRPCPRTAAEQPLGAAAIVSNLPVHGDYLAITGYRPIKDGLQAFCAYLGPSQFAATLTATQTRAVSLPPLAGAVARQTVLSALRRHGFAKRVVAAVDRKCRRKSPREFACAFTAEFTGYSLSGRGRVRLTSDGVAYRFKVEAQDERLVLTDRNEQRGPG
jgi:hypothetical protein